MEGGGRSRWRVEVWPSAACGHGTIASVYSGCIAMARRTQLLAVCASAKYNESQTTASGSLASLVLPLPHLKYTLNPGLSPAV